MFVLTLSCFTNVKISLSLIERFLFTDNSVTQHQDTRRGLRLITIDLNIGVILWSQSSDEPVAIKRNLRIEYQSAEWMTEAIFGLSDTQLSAVVSYRVSIMLRCQWKCTVGLITFPYYRRSAIISLLMFQHLPTAGRSFVNNPSTAAHK